LEVHLTMSEHIMYGKLCFEMVLIHLVKSILNYSMMPLSTIDFNLFLIVKIITGYQ
jgi:hypothetical protein